MGIGTDERQLVRQGPAAVHRLRGARRLHLLLGLRAPALIAFVKDTLIYIVIIVAVIYLPTQLGGWDNIFDTATTRSTTFNTENADAIAAGEAAPKSDDPAAAAALGLRLAGARLGAGAVHVPALGDRGALDTRTAR